MEHLHWPRNSTINATHTYLSGVLAMNIILGGICLHAIGDGIPQPVIPFPLRTGPAVHILVCFGLFFPSGRCFRLFCYHGLDFRDRIQRQISSSRTGRTDAATTCNTSPATKQNEAWLEAEEASTYRRAALSVT